MPEFDPVLRLRALNASKGFKISGEAAGNSAGFSVAPAGDVNGDGFDDVIIGAPFASPKGSYEGLSYVVFGKAQGFDSNLQLSSLDGRNGFQITGEGPGNSGETVAPAGDVNHDGYADIIIGAPFAEPNGQDSGAAYIVFGKPQGFPANVQLSNLNGANGFQISGEAALNFAGFVGAAGDFNGDGFDDVVIGANNAGSNSDQRGATYVVFGQAAGFPANLQLSSLDGANGFQINGEKPGDGASRITSAGDVNGDGIDDIIIGARGADANGKDSGASYVVFGRTTGFPANVQLANLNGANGFQISGEAPATFSGVVNAAGDVNGDGFADVVIGVPNADPNGAAYVVFGKASNFASDLNLSSLNGRNGFQINGETEGDASGRSVAAAGDVNGDGFDDIVIGAPFADANVQQNGASYVVFGQGSPFRANLQLSSLNGDSGFKILGERSGDQSGYAVASAGDVNADGFADAILGSWLADPNGDASGAAHVVFGHRAFEAVARTGTALDNTINGGSGNDTISGLEGDDRLIAWEGNDLVIGGRGRDLLNGRAGFDRLIGGANADVLIGGLGNDIFDFNAVTDSGATAGSRDVIRDFTHGQDKIDLSDLGDLAFIGTAAFTAPGQVRVVQAGPNAIIEVNLSGDAAPEMTILLQDVAAASLTGADFIL